MSLWARFDMSVVYHDVIISCMRVYLAPGHMYDLVCVVRRYDTDHDTELLFTLPTQLRSAHSSIFVFVYKAMTWPANYQWTSRHYLIWRQSKFMQSACFYHPWPCSFWLYIQACPT